ncbi:MAG: helix-hairpin-helix domain-containing protein [Proteobacteria bacterium]|nr:MAG: helix-hairpin-helix domain-containing protein [Pseudomonadota bacterium]QKK11270.1 MAG: helix-hairpin-helix domain-containing protein [Pseudomonadota bacterium]
MRRLLRCFIFTLSLFAVVPAFAEPVDINTADVAVLAQAIKGVGEKKAAAIVAFRNQHGPFKSVDDLTQVPGIGRATVEANRAELTVGSQ